MTGCINGVTVEEIIRVLRPFAVPASEIDDEEQPRDLWAEDEMSCQTAFYESQQPTVGDCRRARELFERLGGTL